MQWILIPCLGFPLLYTLSETTVVGIGVTRRSGFAMLAAVLAFVFNLLGNWWLIPIFGAAGAAASTCISFLFFLVLRTEFSIYVWKPIPRLSLYIYSSLLASGAVINSLYGDIYKTEMMIFWFGMLSSVFVCFKQELSEIKAWVTLKLTACQ